VNRNWIDPTSFSLDLQYRDIPPGGHDIACMHSVRVHCGRTNKLTPWDRALLEKLIVNNLVKKSPAFNGIRNSGAHNIPPLDPPLHTAFM
jgi:hypothetical protein